MRIKLHEFRHESESMEVYADVHVLASVLWQCGPANPRLDIRMHHLRILSRWTSKKNNRNEHLAFPWLSSVDTNRLSIEDNQEEATSSMAFWQLIQI